VVVNNNGKSGYIVKKSTLQRTMELYDALPKEYRDVLKSTVMNLTVTQPQIVRKIFGTARALKLHIRQKDLVGTRDTYGYNHPDIAFEKNTA